MARYTGPKCRLCRREGVKLFLKGHRCHTVKCALEKRMGPPGQRGKFRRRITPYGLMLREAQKVKRFYGVLDKQFRRFFAMAARSHGNTGERLLILLEKRLDNVVYKMGLAVSRAQARQFVVHGHVKVNGKRVDRPSFLVSPGDVVSVYTEDEKFLKLVRDNMARDGVDVPVWLQVDKDKVEAKVLSEPSIEDVSIQVQEHLVVGLYSR